MSIHQTTQRFSAWRGRLHVCWVTIAVFAIVIAYADGFLVTSLQGAVGAIERNEPPFQRWLRDSTLMLPLFFLAVLAAMLLARRWVGQGHRSVVKFGTTALLIVLFTSGVAIAEVAASSAYDYRLQTRHLEREHNMGMDVGMDMSMDTDMGTGLTALKQDTLDVHMRAVQYASVMLLVTNLVLVIWVMAFYSDRLWRRFDSTLTTTTSVKTEELSLA